jgi:hypothetical protein
LTAEPGLRYRSLEEREGVMAKAYRVKCRASKEIKNPKAVTMKNGRQAIQGVCPTCSTKVLRIGKA